MVLKQFRGHTDLHGSWGDRIVREMRLEDHVARFEPDEWFDRTHQPWFGSVLGLFSGDHSEECA